jgi:hypothetical protein
MENCRGHTMTGIQKAHEKLTDPCGDDKIERNEETRF